MPQLTVGAGRVVLLSRGVDSEVSGPAEELSNEKVVEGDNRRVLESLSELLLSELGDADVGLAAG